MSVVYQRWKERLRSCHSGVANGNDRVPNITSEILSFSNENSTMTVKRVRFYRSFHSLQNDSLRLSELLFFTYKVQVKKEGCNVTLPRRNSIFCQSLTKGNRQDLTIGCSSSPEIFSKKIFRAIIYKNTIYCQSFTKGGRNGYVPVTLERAKAK